jgi:SAM-dependent methyltransferase
MNAAPNVSPAQIMQLITGNWAASAVGAAARYKIFTHLEKTPATPEEIASAAGMPVRAARAVLDAVTGLGLTTVRQGKYSNTPEASAFLVEGKPASLAGMAKMALTSLGELWTALPDALAAGGPKKTGLSESKEDPFWEELVPSIAPLTAPAAMLAAEKLGFARAGEAKILDVGGGSGIFSAMLLQANPKATATQADWPNVNRVGKGFVSKMGVGDRFHTQDGDFHTLDLGSGLYDVAIYSHIAHQESPKSNIEVFRRLKRALKPGGTLVINDFIVDNDRSGPPFALLFHLNMFVATTEGATWKREDYEAWLREAGFSSIRFEPTHGPSTLVLAS